MQPQGLQCASCAERSRWLAPAAKAKWQRIEALLDWHRPAPPPPRHSVSGCPQTTDGSRTLAARPAMTTPTRLLQATTRSPTFADGVTTPPCCRRGRVACSWTVRLACRFKRLIGGTTVPLKLTADFRLSQKVSLAQAALGTPTASPTTACPDTRCRGPVKAISK